LNLGPAMSSSKKSSSSGGGGGGSTSSSSLKQGNLFSFFAKKKVPPPSAAQNAPASKAASSSAGGGPSASSAAAAPAGASGGKSNGTSNNEVTAVRNTNRGSGGSQKSNSTLLSKVHVGCIIAVLWPDDNEYYPARVTARGRNSDSVYTLLYEDGECETIDLRGEKFRFLRSSSSSSKSRKRLGDDEDEAGESDGNKGKRRRVIDDDDDDDESEQEFEFGDDEEMSDGGGGGRRPSLSDGSEFIVDDDEDLEEEEDSEEEFEFEDDDDDDEALMVTDEDEDEAGYSAGKKKKRKSSKGKKTAKTNVRVTMENRAADSQALTPPNRGGHRTITATKASASAAASRGGGGAAPSFITPPNITGSATSATAAAASNEFANFAAFDDQEEENAIAKKDASSLTPARTAAAVSNRVTQSQSQSHSQSPMPSSSSNGAGDSGSADDPQKVFRKPSPPKDKTVNPAGTHWHNHFKFLHPAHRKDANGRSTSHPDYDSRTLRVDKEEIRRVRGSKLTPAQEQWWDIKARYADAILLFKTGKFYEIFHQDADVAVQVLDFVYMKGCDAHAGFPEISYGQFCDRLVRAGYKVARVEQTETPEMLKERKNQAGKGKKPMVVNREVCSVTTAGTRTFCFMDDSSALATEGGMGAEATGGIGPLIVIKETLVESNGSCEDDGDADGDDGSVKPVCEYGVAIVDAVRGTVTLGQFADDVLRSRMLTLLTNFAPSEILIEGGTNGASDTLKSLLDSTAATSAVPARIGYVNLKEIPPRSNALDGEARKKFDRPTPTIHPWDVDETLAELHRRSYYPRASRKEPAKYDKNDPGKGTARWPEILRSCVVGGASLALSAFGAALFYLQRGLIDDDILTMGIVKAYIPPAAASGHNAATEMLQKLSTEEQRKQGGIEVTDGDQEESSAPPSAPSKPSAGIDFTSLAPDEAEAIAMEAQIDHMALDGTTLANLEILANSHSNTAAGSLWSKINYAKSPHGSRLLRAWLLRPLFRKVDIDRRADAVEELVSGGPAAALSEARSALAKMGDVERLLSRVHSMGGAGAGSDTSSGSGLHPNDRAVLYEDDTYTKRKVGDFSKLLRGLHAAAAIPELFEGVNIESGLLAKIVRTKEAGGCFPSNLVDELDWFFDNFDSKKAAAGQFEPSRGMDDDYDAACDALERIKRELDDYKQEMCSEVLHSSAKHAWKYINTKENSKDKYLIELPASISVPNDFFVKGKRGSGHKQVNKYRTPVVEGLVQELEQAIDIVNACKARGMQLIFAKFDSMRPTWAAAATATAMLDALGALAEAASQPGFTRPTILECPPDGKPSVTVVQGRHPCVEVTHSGGDFVPNDLSMGGTSSDLADESRVLLLSGPNMGGKSTLLRQTCLITILAQIGCFVPAEQCSLTPVDRIFTRLGASDRILLGQSTFFVELAETAAALRGATRRSLVIMDELGRGTSTFDGTAIASASVKHLVERNRCLALFATHYHSLLEDWKEEPSVRLGHMECVVEGDDDSGDAMQVDAEESENKNDHNITFLYTLGEGTCPKSFGINVARLAALPEEVLTKAKEVSSNFEAELNGSAANHAKISPSSAVDLRQRIEEAVAAGNFSEVEKLWQELQS